MPQVIITNVEHDCDGIFTTLYRFDVPPCVTRATREGDEHAAARWIAGVVGITDPSDWWTVDDLNAVSSVLILPADWSHADGIDFTTFRGNIFA